MGGVAIADNFTRHTLTSISRVSHKTRQASLALRSHGVILALCTRVERLWTKAIAVAIAVAGKLAVGTCPSKVTGAEVRRCAGAVLARLLANRLTPTP